MKKLKVLGAAILSVAAVLMVAGCNPYSQEDLDKAVKEAEDKAAAEKEEAVKEAKTTYKYVDPVKYNVTGISALAVTAKVSAAKSARAVEETTEDAGNLVAIDESGNVETVIQLVTAEETTTEETTDTTETTEEEYVVPVYIDTAKCTVADVLDTIQCTYELNDKEASGYYLIYSGKSTFVYSDGTTTYKGSLIYVTPDGVERDIFGSINNYDAMISLWNRVDNGNPYMVFDENGNAFFMAYNNGNKIYRYQPIADKIDDLTPAGLTDYGFSDFAVSLDGKYIIFTCTYDDAETTKELRSVKAVKIADKSVIDIYTSKIPENHFGVSNYIYVDKNHSFFFLTDSWERDDEEVVPEYDNVENYMNRWEYETNKLTRISYLAEDSEYKNELGDITEGGGPLISCDEGIFTMRPQDWSTEKDGWTCSLLLKFADADGNFIKPEIPSSLKERKFAPPRYNQAYEAKEKDPSTWYTPSYLSNGTGIAVIGTIPESSAQDTIYYYANGELKNLLAYDTDKQTINKMSLSDKSIIFNAEKKTKTVYTKSVNLEDGSVSTISKDGKDFEAPVLNVMAVKGKSISAGANTQFTCSVTIEPQADVTITDNSTGNTLKLTAATGYDSYEWSCNGLVLGTTSTLEKTFDAAGYYPILLKAKKGSMIYSEFIEVKITK